MLSSAANACELVLSVEPVLALHPPAFVPAVTIRSFALVVVNEAVAGLVLYGQLDVCEVPACASNGAAGATPEYSRMIRPIPFAVPVVAVIVSFPPRILAA